MKVNDCILCGKQPKIVKTAGIYYAQCCTNRTREPWSFCGLKYETALKVWNENNPNDHKITNKGIRYTPQVKRFVYKGKPYTARELAKLLKIKPSTIYSLFYHAKADHVIYNGEPITRIQRSKL